MVWVASISGTRSPASAAHLRISAAVKKSQESDCSPFREWQDTVIYDVVVVDDDDEDEDEDDDEDYDDVVDDDDGSDSDSDSN